MMTLDWAFVLHDNHRLMPVVRRIGGKAKAFLVTSAEYRAAKHAAELLLQNQWKGDRLQGPVQLFAHVWFPDARKRDAGNYRKLVTDALSGIAYVDDSQIHREVWEFAGIDRTRPRIMLEVQSFGAT